MKASKPTNGTRITDENEFSNLWQKIESYEMPFREDYLEFKHKWDPDFGWEAIVEYRKFIFLTLVSDSEVTPSETIDEVWHLHILHTRAYQAFANLCGRFIHHGPGMPNERKRWDRQYEVTFRLYREIFGEEPPQAFWPQNRIGRPESNGGTPKISAVLELFRKFDLQRPKVQTPTP